MTELAGKRLQLLREIVTNLRRLAVLFDVGYSGSELQMRELQTTAHKLGVEVEPTRIRRSENIAPSFEALKFQKVDALYVVENSLTMANGRQIAASALSITVVIFCWQICLISESMGHHDSEIMDDRSID